MNNNTNPIKNIAFAATKRAAIFAIIFIFMSQNLVYAYDKFEDNMQMLFGETKSWIYLTDNQKATVDKFKKNKFSIEYVNKTLHQLSNKHTQCSPIEEMLGKSWKVELLRHDLYVIDINRDGYEDVIFTGNALCDEGTATIVWFGTKNGSLMLKQSSYWPIRLVSISPDGKMFSSVKPGCCDDIINIYAITDVLFSERFKEARLSYITDVPNKITHRPLIIDTEIILRSGSEVRDRHFTKENGDYVNTMILATYERGQKIVDILSERNISGKKWIFVHVPHKYLNMRIKADPDYPATVGWIMLN